GSILEQLQVETRIVAIETNISNLASSLEKLSNVVSINASMTNQNIEKLTDLISKANSPKPISWALVISFCFFAMALGGAALSPLWMRIGDIQTNVAKQENKFSDHEKLKLHPVGEARIDAMEKSLTVLSSTNTKDINNIDIKINEDIQDVKYDIRDIQLNGSPVLREKLGMINKETQWLKESFKEVELNGSPITRERLATIENEIKNIKEHIGTNKINK
ncbi:MAG: hypothetical protein AABY22_35080, partial [Nanoarchaeota archaeon]